MTTFKIYRDGVFDNLFSSGDFIVPSGNILASTLNIDIPSNYLKVTNQGSVVFNLIDGLLYYSNGTIWQSISGGTAVSSITGISNKIIVNGVSGTPETGAVTVSISSTYIGQSSITTLGTITTGVWNGTVIPVLYGGTGQSSYTDGQLLIGDSVGNTLVKSTITAGSGISVTNGNGTITIAASGGGSILSTLVYNPSGDNVYTSSSTSLTAIDTTNLRITFTAPSSGNVLLQADFVWSTNDIVNNVQIGWINGGTTIAQGMQGRTGPALINRQTTTFKVTGLTPTNSYSFDFSYASSGSTNMSIYYGTTTPYGPITLIVSSCS